MARLHVVKNARGIVIKVNGGPQHRLVLLEKVARPKEYAIGAGNTAFEVCVV